MAHYYQKRWVFTWNADDRGQLVDHRKLEELLNEIAREGVFQVIEELKNGYIVSAMFGRPLEVLIDIPFVLIMTNEDISSYFHYLSMDRWYCYEIRENELFKIRKTPGYSPHDSNSRYISLD